MILQTGKKYKVTLLKRAKVQEKIVIGEVKQDSFISVFVGIRPAQAASEPQLIFEHKNQDGTKGYRSIGLITDHLVMGQVEARKYLEGYQLPFTFVYSVVLAE